ncbi:MAG: agmatine deiminase family protein [bacterium]|nr:agmatine deiminase family protein [bacterium]
MNSSHAKIQNLSRLEESRLSQEVEEAAVLFSEHQQFISLQGRRGIQTRESLAFVQRCRRELQALGQHRELSDLLPSIPAQARFRLAQLELLAGEYSLALNSLRSALELAQQAQDKRLEGLIHNTLGVASCDLGEHETALQHFEIAAQLLEAYPVEVETRALALRNQSIVSHTLGRTDKSAINAANHSLVAAGAVAEMGPASEILCDTQIAMALQLLTDEDYAAASRILKAADNLLDFLIDECTKTNFETEIVSLRRYQRGKRLVRQQMNLLEQVVADPRSDAGLPLLNWNWLYDVPATVVAPSLSVESHMLAEFETQNGMAVTWSGYPAVQELVKQIIRNCHDRLRLTVVCSDDSEHRDVTDFLEQNQIASSQVQIVFASLDSPWLRDMGPIAGRSKLGDSIWIDSHVVRDTMKPRVEVDGLPGILSDLWSTARYRSALSVEGGAILTNGHGLVVCSTNVMERNIASGFSSQTCESELRRITGAQEIVFIDPLLGESTGHIDLFMTFISSDTVVVAEYRDRRNPNAALLDRHAARLAEIRVDGKPMQVVRVSMPPAGTAQFINYTNVLFANGKLLIPSWSTASPQMEDEVRGIYQKLLPDWEIVSIDCSGLAPAGGALHCLTSNLGAALPQSKSP